jgi:hypothetical protein
MDYSAENLARITSVKLQEEYPNLPEVTETQFEEIKQGRFESTSKSLEALNGIVAIAGFIIQLADFIIDRIRELKNNAEYRNYTKSRKKAALRIIILRDFKSTQNVNNEIEVQIIDIQTEEIVDKEFE